MSATKLVHGYEVVIGFETHAQLSTQSKIFSRASIAFGAEPNTQACAVDLALPGTLPVMNKGAVERAIELGLALGLLGRRVLGVPPTLALLVNARGAATTGSGFFISKITSIWVNKLII